METNNKLREALCEILSYIEDFHKYITPGKGKKLTALFAVADTIRNKARAALAEPVKNCEVGTLEEQSERLYAYCKAHRDKDAECLYCPMFGQTGGYCELVWAQLPYESEETK